jgi:thioredoxin 1
MSVVPEARATNTVPEARTTNTVPEARRSSTPKLVTDESFEAEVLNGPRPVIVEYWAPWCGPCRQVSPVLDAIASEYAGRVDVVKVNVDENPRTVQKYAVLLVPTLSMFAGGELVKQVIGARSKSALLREFGDFIEPGGQPG